MRYIYVILFLLVLQNAVAQDGFIQSKTDFGNKGSFVPELQNKQGDLNFLVLGDFGRAGAYFQKEVAEQLGNAAKILDTEFVLSVGDNFYPNGVASIHDEHWDISFNDVYTHPALYIDWFVALGNHDHRGDIQAQIEYSTVSRRWNMPSSYYSKTFPLKNGGKLLLVVLDTNPFIKSYQGQYAKYPALKEQDAAQQKQWLIETLQTKDEAIVWKIVVGHHPMYSGGKRKTAEDTLDFEAQFANLFDEHQVDAYICGHEHDLQIIQPEGRFTTQFLSGAASELRPSGSREGTIFAVSEPGFMSFTISDDKMKIQTIKAKENEIELLHTMEINRK